MHIDDECTIIDLGEGASNSEDYSHTELKEQNDAEEPFDRLPDKEYTEKTSLKLQIEPVHEKYDVSKHSSDFYSSMGDSEEISQTEMFSPTQAGKNPDDKGSSNYTKNGLIEKTALESTNNPVIEKKEKKINCSICDRNFTQKKYLKVHLKRTHNIKELHTCSMCTIEFLSERGLELHKSSGQCRTKLEKESAAIGEDKKANLKKCKIVIERGKCDICGAMFDHKSNLDKHKKMCNQIFNLSLKQVLHQDIDQQSNDDMGGIGEEPTEPTSSKQAIKSVIEENKVHCSICERSFTQEKHLKIHFKKSHETVKNSDQKVYLKTMIKMAIRQSPKKKLTIEGICKFIQRKFPTHK